METPESKKPKRKGLIIGGIVALFAVIGITGSPTTSTDNSTQQPQTTTNIPAAAEISKSAETAQTAAPVEAPASAPVVAPQPSHAPAAPTPKPKTCGSGYYLNVDGNCVQSPTAAPSAPAGATAECRDGTYSFSQNHSGTCSHHGGVASWL